MGHLTLRDILLILRHGKHLGTIVFGSVFAVSLFAMFFFAPVYEVSTTVIIEQEDPTALMLPNPATLLLGAMQPPENETELIKSRVVTDTLIDKFNLQFPMEHKGDAFVFHLVRLLRGGPEFIGSPYFAKVHPALVDIEGTITATTDGYRIANGSEEAACLWGESCRFAGGEIVTKKVGDIPEGERYSFSYRNYVKTRKVVNESFDAFPLDEGKTPTLFRITMETTNTPFAALFLNELVATFAAKKVQWRTESIEVTRNFLEKLATRLKEERDDRLRKLTAFMSEKRTILPDEQVKSLFLEKMELEKQKKEIEIRRSLIGELRKSLKEGDNHMIPAPMLEDDKAFGEVIAAYNALVMQEKKVAEVFFDSHPDLLALRQQIAATRQTIATMIADTDANIRQVEALLSEKMAGIDAEMSRLPPQLSELAILKAEEEAVEKIYWFLNEKIYENEIKKESMKHDIRIIDPADPREEKKFPRISISVLLATALAFLVALAAVFGRYFFRRSLSFEEELDRFLPFPHRRFVLPSVMRGQTTEEFDRRISRLLAVSGFFDARKGVIVLCSIEEGSGKSFIAGRLREVLASLGYRVALFGGRAAPRQVPDRSNEPQERSLLAASAGANPISDLRASHDIVILDLPPVSVSAESLAVAGEADYLFLVVRPGMTPRNILARYFTMLLERVPNRDHTAVIVNDSPCVPL